MMNHYIGTKFVDAEPQRRTVIKEGEKTAVAPEGMRIPTRAWIREHGIDPDMAATICDVPGYKVRYPDGYESWSPQDVFEKAYRPMSSGMNFSDALEAMKSGFVCGRDVWVDKVVVMRKGYTNIIFNEDTQKAFNLKDGATGDVLPYLQAKVGATLQVYIPTMIDLMANDWHWIIEDPNGEFNYD